MRQRRANRPGRSARRRARTSRLSPAGRSSTFSPSRVYVVGATTSGRSSGVPSASRSSPSSPSSTDVRDGRERRGRGRDADHVGDGSVPEDRPGGRGPEPVGRREQRCALEPGVVDPGPSAPTRSPPRSSCAEARRCAAPSRRTTRRARPRARRPATHATRRGTSERHADRRRRRRRRAAARIAPVEPSAGEWRRRRGVDERLGSDDLGDRDHRRAEDDRRPDGRRPRRRRGAPRGRSRRTAPIASRGSAVTRYRSAT